MCGHHAVSNLLGVCIFAYSAIVTVMVANPRYVDSGKTFLMRVGFEPTPPKRLVP